MSDGDDPAPTPKAPPKKKPRLKGIRERYPGSFSIVMELGYETDATTGARRRVQKWINFKATPGVSVAEQRKEAEAERDKLRTAKRLGTFVKPSKLTLIDWLRAWLATAIVPKKRPATVRAYRNIVERHIAKSGIAMCPIQGLVTSDLEGYLAGISAGSVALHAAVLHSALKRATRDKLLSANPARDWDYGRADNEIDHEGAVRENCWSVTERAAVLAVLDQAPLQVAAYVRLALDSGARRSELNGLGWEHLDFHSGVLWVRRQLDKATSPPTFGPPKGKKHRSIHLLPETLSVLERHRKAQLALKLKNGAHYHDYGLMFAKEPLDLQTQDAALGQPIQTLSESKFQRLVEMADVRRITFHGCRHTVATILLQAGVPVNDVSKRLGHKKVSITMDIYAHSLPDQQAEAAATFDAFTARRGRPGM